MKIKKAKITRKANQILIPTTQLQLNEKNAIIFNNMVKKYEKYNPIVRTNKGSISYTKTILPAFDVRKLSTIVELTVLAKDGMFRLQLRNLKEDIEDNDEISGMQSLKLLKRELQKDGVNLDDYAVKNGKELRNDKNYTKDMEYLIKLNNPIYADKTFKNAHHIDFHSSFPSGLVITHPEFYPTINRLYKERKVNEEYKAVLNKSIGTFWSKIVGYKYITLAHDAIQNNDIRLLELAKRLEKSGRVILAFNTDGIWYVGKEYHGKGEGNNLGEWSNDHINCKIRFKSAGAYEFIENEKYYPVLRGSTRLDAIKERSSWQWGDIYQDIIVFNLTGNFITNEEGVKYGTKR